MRRHMFRKISILDVFHPDSSAYKKLFYPTAIKDVFDRMIKAASENNYDDIKNLVKQGYSVNLLYGNVTPISYFVQQEKIDIVTTLIEQYDGCVVDALKGYAFINSEKSKLEIDRLLNNLEFQS